MTQSYLIFDDGLLPVIKELLPAGVSAIGPISRGTSGFSQMPIEGDCLPPIEEVRMSVELDLVGNVPVRIVTFEALAA